MATIFLKEGSLSENALTIKLNTIILLTKKVIYKSIKRIKTTYDKGQKRHKKIYFQEKYRHYIRGRCKVFDKEYVLLSTMQYDNQSSRWQRP